MRTLNRINIQEIAFESNAAYANIFCNVNEQQESVEMIVEQRFLNLFINKIQATQSEDEVLNYLESVPLGEDTVIYNINLKNSNYENAWIELDDNFNNYQLIRA